MPHNVCPPSRRGHTWREPPTDDPRARDLSLRVCARCGHLGRVNKQGVIYVLETAAVAARPDREEPCL